MPNVATPADTTDLKKVMEASLFLAVSTLAFHGRDRGTDRQEGMLDALEVVATQLDDQVRAALAALDWDAPQLVGDWCDIARAPRNGTWFIARSPMEVRLVRFLDPTDRLPCALDERAWTQLPTHFIVLNPVIANLIAAQVEPRRNRLPDGHVLISAGPTADGLISQTIRMRSGQEYQRVIHPDEADAERGQEYFS